MTFENVRNEQGEEMTNKETLYYFHERFQELGLTKPTIPARGAPGLANVRLENKQVAQMQLDPIEKGVLFGTLCGDTAIGIQKGYKNARMSTRQSTRQFDWFFWKWTVACPNYCTLNSMIWQRADGYQLGSTEQPGEKLGKLKLATAATPHVTAIYHILCENAAKRIKRSWLNHMNDYFLMALWLDDGSLNSGAQGVICMDLFPLRDQKVFVAWLKTAWGVHTYTRTEQGLTVNGQTRHRIYFVDNEELLKFLRIIAPIIPVPSMLYKVFYVSNNNFDSTQRWAREVVGLVKPEFRAIAENYYKDYLNPK